MVLDWALELMNIASWTWLFSVFEGNYQLDLVPEIKCIEKINCDYYFMTLALIPISGFSTIDM